MVFFKKNGFSMVRKIVLISLFYFSTFILSSMEYEEFVDIILKNNKEYQTILSQYNIKKMQAFNLKYDWVPKPNLDLNYIGNSNLKSKNQIHGFTAGISILQSMPMGMNFNINISNSFLYSKINSINNQYDANLKLNFSMPLYFFAPALLKPYSYDEIFAKKVSLNIALLELEQAKERIIVSAIYTVGIYRINEELLKLEEQKSTVDIELGINDEALWRQGKLSTLELSERETQRYNNKIKLLNLKNKYLKMMQSLKLTGFDKKITPLDIELWIKNLEKYIETKYKYNDKVLFIQENNLRLNRYYSLLKEMNKMPKLIFSFKANPDSETVGGNYVNDTIKNYWQSKKNWKFDFSLGINIPLSPLDEVYTIDKATREILKITKLNYQILQEKYRNKKENYKIDIGIAEENYRLAKKFEENALNRLEFSNSLLQQGYITEVDLKINKLNYEKAKLQSLEAYLNYIISRLSYNIREI